jgi:hypothetical protein
VARSVTEQRRVSMRGLARRLWADPDFRERMSSMRKGRKHTEGALN